MIFKNKLKKGGKVDKNQVLKNFLKSQPNQATIFRGLVNDWESNHDLAIKEKIAEFLSSIDGFLTIASYLLRVEAESEIRKMVDTRMAEILFDLLPLTIDYLALIDLRKRTDPDSESRILVDIRIDEVLAGSLPAIHDFALFYTYWKQLGRNSKLIENAMADLLSDCNCLPVLINYLNGIESGDVDSVPYKLVEQQINKVFFSISPNISNFIVLLGYWKAIVWDKSKKQIENRMDEILFYETDFQLLVYYHLQTEAGSNPRKIVDYRLEELLAATHRKIPDSLAELISNSQLPEDLIPAFKKKAYELVEF